MSKNTRTLKLMEWNIGMGSANLEAKRAFPVDNVNEGRKKCETAVEDDAIIKGIDKHDPDIFILVEFNDAFSDKESNRNILFRKLSKSYEIFINPGFTYKDEQREKKYPHYGVCIGLKSDTFDATYSKILSEKAQTDKVKSQYNKPYPNFLIVQGRTRVEGKFITICGLRNRYSMYLNNKKRKNRSLKYEQIVTFFSDIYDQIKLDDAKDNVIIAGDFNLEMTKDAKSTWACVKREFESRNLNLIYLPDNAVSYRSINSTIRQNKVIDFIFKSPNLTNARVEYLWDFLKDDHIDKDGNPKFENKINGRPDHAILIAHFDL